MGTLSTFRMLLRVLVLATLVVFSFAKEKTIQRQKKCSHYFLWLLFQIINVPDPLLHHLKKYWVPATPRPNVLPKAGRLTGTVQQVLECAARSWSLIVVQLWTITVPTFKTHHIQQRIQLQDLAHIPYHL